VNPPDDVVDDDYDDSREAAVGVDASCHGDTDLVLVSGMKDTSQY